METNFGFNSGIDTADLITKLVALQRRPINLVQTKKAFDDLRLKAFKDLQSELTAFQGVVGKLNTQSQFLVREGTFVNTNPGDVNPVAGLEVTSQAVASQYALDVTQIAKETKTASQGFATSSTVVGSGTLTLTIGGVATNITLDASNNTVEGIRDAINNAGLNVRASLLNDGDPANPIRLLVSGTETGLDNAVSISIKDGGGVDLATFTETQGAQNALFTLDGVSISKAGNTVTDVIEGATLNLLSAGQGTLSISTDQTAIKENIQSFADGYNKVISFINEQLKFDLDSDTEGTLFGNFTLLNIQTNLRSTVTGPVDGASGTFSFLSQIGIRTAADGTLTVNDTELENAIAADIDSVVQLFTGTGQASQAGVAFVAATGATEGGTYDLRVLGGVPQLSVSGQNLYTDAVGSGNFYTGAEGTAAEGLSFRIDSLVDGDYGTLTFEPGVAESINRLIEQHVGTGGGNPLEAEIDTLTDTLKDFDNQIIDLEGRLEIFEENLRREFVALEGLLAQLDSQRQAFTSAMAGLDNLFTGR